MNNADKNSVRRLRNRAVAHVIYDVLAVCADLLLKWDERDSPECHDT